MSSLLDFPLPIVEDIVKFLCPHCYPARVRDQHCHHPACPSRPNDREGQAALASLRRTNRLLNYIATPLLYHTPFCGYRLKAQQNVAETILDARAELAQHVKSVHLDQSDFAESLLSGGVNELIEKAAGRLEAVADVDRSWTPYFLALIAGTCTNMEELCILAHDGEQSPVPFSAPGSLPKLERLAVSHWDTEGGFDISSLRDLFAAAPNITSLSVCNMVSIQPGMNMQNMKEINLYNTVLEADELRILLEQCPKLEQFNFHISDACVTLEGWPTAREVQDVISHTSPGLKHLRLEVGEGVFDLNEATEEDTLRSLKLLKCLEELELQEEFLYPGTMVQNPSDAGVLEPEALVDLLPASIRTVRIGMVEGGGVRPLVPAILMLGRVCKEEFPHLESIWFHNLAVDADAERQARELFEGQGVTFRSELQPYWEE
ncbi:hypothetical protein CMUS01_12426 [Colletotrichum musicola]|uniref:F-box domain-containing protein n=1 Tax=Colletotrichum musicola TaxID=2175873 RepID=A0A8H6N081_9PEZI|nr:hypothetical protein CMUS01_12426 [Colletotrichum musicola]